MPPTNPPVTYKPSAFYFRDAIYEAESIAELKAIALQAVRELEHHKEWIRALGLIPPKRFILSTEAEEKGIVIPFPSSDERHSA